MNTHLEIFLIDVTMKTFYLEKYVLSGNGAMIAYYASIVIEFIGG